MKLRVLRLQSEWVWASMLFAAVLACVWPLRQIARLEHSQAALEHQFMKVQALAAQARKLQSAQELGIHDAAAALQAGVAREWAAAAVLLIRGQDAVLTLNKIAAASIAPGLERIQRDTHAVFTASKWVLQGDSVSGTVEIQLPGAP